MASVLEIFSQIQNWDALFKSNSGYFVGKLQPEDQKRRFVSGTLILTGNTFEGMLSTPLFRYKDQIPKSRWFIEMQLDLVGLCATFRDKGEEQAKYLEPSGTPGSYFVRKYPESASLDEDCSFKMNICNDSYQLPSSLFKSGSQDWEKNEYVSGEFVKEAIKDRGLVKLQISDRIQRFSPFKSNFRTAGGYITVEERHKISDGEATGCFLIKDEGVTVFDLSCNPIPAIQLHRWPDAKAEKAWVNRIRKGWPSEDLVKEIVAEGATLVPKMYRSPSKPEWMMSFPVAEEKLASASTPEQQLTYHVFRSVYYFSLKKQPFKENFKEGKNEEFEVAEGEERSFPSYFAKTIMLWECEKHPLSQWSSGKVVENVRILLLSLLSAIQTRKLPHYFLPEINLMADVTEQLLTEADEKITEMIEDPLNGISEEMADKVLRMARLACIPFYDVHFQEEFKELVKEYMAPSIGK